MVHFGIFPYYSTLTGVPKRLFSSSTELRDMSKLTAGLILIATDLESELKALNKDLTKNQRQIDYLLAEQNKLTDRKEVLEREINSRKKVQIADVDPKWNADGE